MSLLQTNAYFLPKVVRPSDHVCHHGQHKKDTLKKEKDRMANLRSCSAYKLYSGTRSCTLMYSSIE